MKKTKANNFCRELHKPAVRHYVFLYNGIAHNRLFFAALFFILVFHFFADSLHAQTGSYLIPRQIFVGDPATLVLPLPAASQNYADIIIASPSDYLPKDPNIDFHRVILEQRVMGSRLLIEFPSFIPGILEFPVIEIGGEYFSGLSVAVNSIIEDRSSPVLSGPASALAIPGTAFMLYGTLTAIVIIILLVILFIFKGKTFLKKLLDKWRLGKLFNSIRLTEKHLRKSVLKESDKRVILDILSDEFRIFLSSLTGINCRSMTAREFEQESSSNSVFPISVSLSDYAPFFRRLDDYRFSGISPDSSDIIALLDDLKQFLVTLENSQKEFEQKDTDQNAGQERTA